MVSYNLNILGHRVKLTPMKSPRIKLPDVDKDGNPVKKLTKQKAIYEWVNEQGLVVDKVYKKFGDKVINKLKRTDNIQRAITCPKMEAYGLIEEACYFVDADESFKRELIDNDKALKFVFSNGNGFQAYPLTYIVGDGDDLIMICGVITKAQAKKWIKEGKGAIEELEALKSDGVDNANADELASLYVLN